MPVSARIRICSSGSRPPPPGRMIPSLRRRRVSSSSQGRPISPRKTAEGKGTANSSVKWHEPRSTKASMKWFTRDATSSSISSIFLGAKSGSRIRRYFLCSGGSTLRGMSGRTFPSWTMSREVNVAGSRSTSSTAARLATTVKPSAGTTTPPMSMSSRYLGCGSARSKRSSIPSTSPRNAGALRSRPLSPVSLRSSCRAVPPGLAPAGPILVADACADAQLRHVRL